MLRHAVAYVNATTLRDPAILGPMSTTIGARIREARNLGKLARKDVARQAGMAYSTLADLENEASQKTTNIASLAAALGVVPAWLETGTGPMRPSGQVAPDPPAPPLPPAKAEMLADFDLLLEGDQTRIAGEIKRLADVARAYREMFAQASKESNADIYNRLPAELTRKQKA